MPSVARESEIEWALEEAKKLWTYQFPAALLEARAVEAEYNAVLSDVGHEKRLFARAADLRRMAQKVRNL